MNGLFALGFGAPLALVGLLALPLIWWLVRRTPPAPTVVDFPPTALMRDLVSPDETPASSPWWLLLLRLGLAALLVLALAEPSWRPDTTSDDGATGPLWLILDDGWPAAEGWDELRTAAERRIAAAEARGRPVVLAASADGADQPLAAADAATARTRLAALTPRPWNEDRASLLPALAASARLAAPGSVVWLTHGVDTGTPEVAPAFADALARLAPAAPRTLSLPARLDVVALTGHTDAADALRARLVRPVATEAANAIVRALDARGRPLAETAVALPAGTASAEARIDLPAELRNEVARLEIAGHAGAGAVRLLDQRGRRRSVGLLAGTGFERDQPLLAPGHYVANALLPFADLRRPETADTAAAVTELTAAGLSVLVTADVGTFPADAADRLKRWVEAGGTLVRFAGPRMTPSRDGDAPRPVDALLPIVPRAGERAFGGALTWETPRGLGPFAETGPFAGLPVPADVRVTRQILAEPGPGLTERTWASLDDGTPLVTAAPLGRGRLVFVHVGADPAWSNLPLTDTFVEMLRRLVALSAAGSGAPASAATALPPWRLLDGFGRLRPVGEVPGGAEAKPIAAKDIASARPSRAHPPGLWGTEGATVALDTLRPDDRIEALAPHISGRADLAIATRVEADPIAFGPGLLLAALALALLDGLLALGAGALPLGRLRRILPLLAFAAGLAILAPPGADAAPTIATVPPTPTAAEPELPAPALAPRLAFVLTGRADIDDVARRGLSGLSRTVAARTSFEPAEPAAVDPETDDLSFYPLLYWPVDPDAQPLSPTARGRIDAYLKTGGTILFDTRDADEAIPGRPTAAARALRRLTDGLDLPALEPVPADHVLTRTFYLLRSFPGRTDAGRLWVEVTPDADRADGERSRSGDGVSPVLVTGNDFAGAWAIGVDGEESLPMTSGDGDAREMALRVGVNVVMYVLTGNYKADQVHIPLILKRLGR